MSDNKLSRTIASTATLRLANIRSLDLFYTPIEERFERITRLARRALHVPVAAITLVNGDKQWFKSVAGWTVAELPRAHGLCHLTVGAKALTVIGDTTTDPRSAASPIVVRAPHFRAYAGAPIGGESGAAAGTFCVFDVRPRRFSAGDRQCVLDLAAMTESELFSDRLSDAHAELTAKLGMARREAMMDSLTRLWNRRGSSVLLKAALAKADEGGMPVSIALLDLDNFKRVNDTYGHQTGDEVLRKVAARMVGAVRNDDVVCRLGGDEFLIVMTDTVAAVASSIVERVRSVVTETALATRDGNIPMSVSVGCTVRVPHDPASLEALLERADQALLQSKAAGRNRVRMTS